jgi:hypothetical protein
MPLLLDFVRAIGIRCEDFHQDMVATLAESRSVGGEARGATLRHGTLRCLNENVYQ